MPDKLPSTADVVIVGGGIMGASTAWQLAKRGAGKIVLLERSTIASAASGRTGALLRQHYSNLSEGIFAQRSLGIFAGWREQFGDDIGFDQCGVIVTVPTRSPFQSNIDRMHRNVARLNSIGTEIEIVTPEQLRTIEPAGQWNDIVCATWEPASGAVDAGAATRSMIRAAERAGAHVFEGITALSMLTSGSTVTGVETSAGVISAPQVVLANGVWSTPLAATVGVDIPLHALRVQIAFFQRPRAMEAAHTIVLDNAAGLFTRPTHSGRSLVGYAGGDQHDPVDPDNYDPRNDLAYIDVARNAMVHRFPGFAGASYMNGHACLYDMSPDTHAILGPAGPDGLQLAVGFSGSGFKKGPSIGEAIADNLLTGVCTWNNLERFSLQRFSKVDWQNPWAADEYELESDFGHGL